MSKPALSLAVSLLCALAAVADAAPHETASAVAVDPNGTIYVAGSAHSTFLETGPSASDPWLVQYDSDGTLIWRRETGTELLSEDVVAIASDPRDGGGVYLLGSSRDADRGTGIWLEKIGPDGSVMWVQTPIPGPAAADEVYAHGMAVDHEGNSYVAGYYTDASGDVDVWVGAYSPEGAHLWTTPLATEQHEFAFSIASDGLASLYVVGYTYDSDLSQSLPEAEDDGCAPSTDGKRAFIAKLTSEGALSWVRALTLDGSNVLSAVTVDPLTQAIYAAGYTSGTVASGKASNNHEALIARVDPDGTVEWYQQVGEHGTDLAFGVAPDGRGGVFVAGSHENSTSVGVDSDAPWLARFNAIGQLIWSEVVSRGGVGRALTSGPDGEPILAGDSEPTELDGYDAWVAKYDRQGNGEWQRSIPASGTSTAGTPVTTTAMRRDAIEPSVTDPDIRFWDDPHLVYRNPEAAGNRDLFLYLPGSNGRPSGATLLLNALAESGHYAIGLRYPNTVTVGRICNTFDPQNPNCHAQVRGEIITGQDLTPYIKVNRTNSIENRLVKLLQYLSKQYPSEGWDRWLEGGEPVWSNIAVAGHSQGGGHAALIGKLNAVARVVMLGAPADNLPDGRNAPWLGVPGATAAERYFGLVHINDPGYHFVKMNWDSLGLCEFGPPTLVDQPFPPLSSTHQLVTAIPPETGIDYGHDAHDSVAINGKTPVTPGGGALYSDDDVWGYLFGTLAQ